MPQLMVQIDGSAVPLRDCFWVLFGPDGCAVGTLTGESAFDADAAFAAVLQPRDHQTRQGYRIDLLHRPQWREQAQACYLGECQHRQGKAA